MLGKLLSTRQQLDTEIKKIRFLERGPGKWDIKCLEAEQGEQRFLESYMYDSCDSDIFEWKVLSSVLSITSVVSSLPSARREQDHMNLSKRFEMNETSAVYSCDFYKLKNRE